VGHVDSRPAVHFLQTDLAKSVETLLCPYISPPMAKGSITHCTCSSPLVNAQFNSSSTGEALSGVESRAFARAPEVLSEIGELLYLYLS
jgi:hypothetical protein